MPSGRSGLSRGRKFASEGENSPLSRPLSPTARQGVQFTAT